MISLYEHPTTPQVPLQVKQVHLANKIVQLVMLEQLKMVRMKIY
jgi:hypothetical protein